jgi:hypothetical protein
MINEFIKNNLFNKNGKFEGQRLTRRWFELRNFESIYDKYYIIFNSDEEMFKILRDIEYSRLKFNRTQALSSCLNCGKQTTFISITQGYKLHCSNECAHKTRSKTKQNKSEEEKLETVNKGKETRLLKYGDENYNNREKFLDTMDSLYGGCTLSSIILSKKVAETKQQRYGDPYFNNMDKNKETCLEKYGYDNIFKIPEIKDKIDSTKLDKYGTIHVTQNKEIMNKVNQTNLKKYGVEWSFQSENNKLKSKATWLLNYGCHVSCAEEIKEKIRLTNENKGKWMPLEEWSEFKLYSNAVWKVTNRQDLESLQNFEKRGRNSGEYHIDHKYSIFQGFKDNIPAEIIGSIVNLEMLESRENMSKNIGCSVTKEELYYSYNI